MGDSDYCNCSPIIRLPTREDLLHPDSHITPQEMLKYRTMQGFSPNLSKGSAEHEEIMSSEKLPGQKFSELDKTKNQDFKCAEASLAHYNKIHSANHKLIEATNSHAFFCGWVWYHCVFKAAPETSSTPELFFAELHALGLNKYHVITVTPVVNVARSYECWYCKGKNILHPVLTLSRDPQLLYSEGMIYQGAPFQQLQYQKALEKWKKSYAAYPDACHNSQKISLDSHKASGLESFNLTSKIKEWIAYKDEQMQDVEARVQREKMDGLRSSTWVAELQKQKEHYSQLGLGRKQEITMNHVSGTPSVFGMASYLQAGQEQHQKEPNPSVPSYSSQSHVGHLLSTDLVKNQEVLESVEKSYVVYSQAQCNLQQSSSQFQENFNDASKHRDVMAEETPTASSLLQYKPSVHCGLFSEAANNNTANAAVSETFVSTDREAYVIDGDSTQICGDAQQNTATDAAPSPYSPILPVVAITPTSGHVKKKVKKKIRSTEYNIGGDSAYSLSGSKSGTGYVENEENIQASSILDLII